MDEQKKGKYPDLKNNTPYTVLEEEQYKYGLQNGFILGAGVGLFVGFVVMLVITFYVII